jgi:membrane fusion protein, macrolide-specific efflux system
VQSTVTGSGDLEPVTDEDVNFQTGGTIEHVYVKNGEKVKKGELLATLNPTSAKLTLGEAKAALAAARTTFTTDEGSVASSTSADTEVKDATDYVSDSLDDDATTVATKTVTVTVPATSTSTSPATTSTATSTPTTSTSTTDTTPATSTTATTPAASTQTQTAAAASGSSGSNSSGSSQGTTTTTTTTSASTLAADKLAVYTDEQTVKSDEADLAATRLHAPVGGTITSLEDLTAGDTVSSSSDSSASTSDSSSSDSTGASSGSLGGTTSTSTTASTSSTSSSDFAEITSLHRLSITVAFDESDISKVKVGQAATVTLDALTGVELAANVTAISSLGTTSSSVVSYDVTLTLEQHDRRVKPGIRASAAVIVSQGHGVTVPNDAVTGSGTLGTVTEQVNGKSVQKQVIVGLRGDSRTLIPSGLKAGTELIVKTTLPSESSSASTATSSSASSGTLGSISATPSAGGGGGFPGGGGSGGPP